MKTVRVIALACLTSAAMLVGTSQALGGFFYQNLLNHDMYQPYSGYEARGPDWPGGANSVSQSFVALESGTVTDYYLAVWIWRNTGGGPDFTLTLTDASNNVLDTLSGTAPFAHPFGGEDFTPISLVHSSSSLRPQLVQGNRYTATISVGGRTQATWEIEQPTLIIKQFEEFGLDVVGTAAVPEPSSLVLLGLGALGLGVAKWRRRGLKPA